MRLARSCFAAMLATVSFSAPTMAFDDLLGAAGLFSSDSPYVFDYTAPLGGFANPDAARHGPSDVPLAQALAAGGVDGLTGIDFGKATSVLTIGDPPKTLTLLFGQPGFADGAPQALLARDFEQSDSDGVTIFSSGEDYAIDIANARVPDPFASGMGKSQRLAFADQFVLRTAGWPEMRAALAELQIDSPNRGIWTDMIEGLRAASGAEAHLVRASGWTAEPFLDNGPDLGSLMLDPEAAKAEIMARGDTIPTVLFPYVIFAVSQNATTASVHIALPSASRDLAEAAAKEIADRLAVYPGTPSTPRITIQQTDVSAVAVLSIDMPADQAAEAYELYLRWQGAIYQRAFEPLMMRF